MSYNKERFNATEPDAGSLASLAAWARKQLRSVQRAMPWAPHADTRDFVTVAEGADASAQFQVAANAIGTGTLFVAPRTYRLANVSIPAATVFKPAQGALIIANGPVTIGGTVDAGDWQWIDPTSAGLFSFTTLRQFRAKWFGIVGDGSTSDSAAIDYMHSVIPDYSTVVFGGAMNIAITRAIRRSARRGVKWVSEIPALPDGQGAQITWRGPWPTVVVDGAISASSQSLTSASAPFTVSMVGSRVLITGAGAGGNDHGTIIQSFVSTTQVTLRDAAITSVAGTATVAVGGVMLYDDSSDGNWLKGFALFPAPAGTLWGLDGYIAAGASPVLHAAGYGQFTSAVVGRQIVVYSAGPGGRPFVTTVAGFTDANTITLAGTASTSIASTTLTRWIIGVASNTLPAWTAIETDQSGVNGVTGTACHYEKNLITMTVPFPEYVAVAISRGIGDNQEYHELRGNNIIGGGGSSTLFIPNTTVTTTGGSATLTAAFGIFYTASDPRCQIGFRLRVPDAGAAGGVLDGKIIAIASSTSATMSLNATAGLTRRVILGESVGSGILVGPSSNSKRHIIDSNQIKIFQYGIWQRDGSISRQNNSFTQNEVDYQRDKCSEPTTCIADNTEAALRHLVNGTVGCRESVAHINCRFGNSWMQPNGGYIKHASNGQTVIFLGCAFDNPPVEATSLIHEFTSGNNNLIAEGTILPSPFLTMAQMGYTAPNNAQVTSRGERVISDAPAFVFGLSASIKYSQTNVNQSEPGVTGYAEAQSTETKIGTRGIAANQTGHGGGSTLVGVQGEAATNGDWDSIAGTTFGVRALMPSNGGAGNITTAYGVKVESPAMPNGNITTAYGAYIPKIKTAGVITAWGVYQVDSGDPNLLCGPTHFGLATNTPITNLQVYAASLTPTAVSGASTSRQTFTVTGVTTADKLILNSDQQPVGIGIGNVRVSATDTVEITFVNPTAGSLTPVNGIYNFIAIRS